MSHKPSKFQQKIYDFITDGQGNAVINAVAGSGKTTTILEALKLIDPSKKVLFLAFNKSIANELKGRVPNSSNVHVKTVHGFGMSALRKDFTVDVFSSKYAKMLRDIMTFLQKDDVSAIKPYKFQSDEMKLVFDMMIDFEQEKIDNTTGYFNRIVQLCDLGRLNLIDINDRDKGIDQLYDISNKHNVDIVNGECFRAWNLIKLGVSYTDKIDFTDMVFLPNVFNLSVFKYDYVFIDECQDLNACQRNLMLKAVKRNGRFIAVGDENQAIYGFAGADADSFSKLKELPNTTVLPLSVCYRCSKSIIAKAKNIIPQIEPSDFAKEGVVDYDADLTKIGDNDMVLCRNTYPIVRLCLQLLSQGRKATIMGSDIGRSLSKMIEDTKRKSEKWTLPNVYSRLYNDLDKVCKNIARKEGCTEDEAKQNNTYALAKERIEVIEMLSKNCDTPQEVIEKIDAIFNDESKDGIILSSVHKSKGLESDRVFIIHPELMPSKYARQDWEKVQEENLRYVAYTRAKSYLGFIDESMFDAWADANSESQANNVKEVKESQWVGTVGAKESLRLSIIMIKPISTAYGDTHLFEFIDEEGNVYSKFGKIHERYIVSNHQEIQEGSIVEFDATIKEHKEFRGQKINVLSTLAKITK